MTSHQGREGVLQAISQVEQLSNSINSCLEHEDSRLQWLQTHVIWGDLPEELILESNTNEVGKRKLLHYGHLVKTKSGKSLFGFLFNDLLLLTLPVGSVHETQSRMFDAKLGAPILVQYRTPFLIKEMCNFSRSGGSFLGVVNTVMNETGLESSIAFTYEGKKYNLKADGAAERKSWQIALNTAVQEYADKLSRRERIVGCPDGKGRVKLEIVSATGVFNGDPKAEGIRPYIKVTLGDQSIKTNPAKTGIDPVWNYQSQLVFSDLEKETIWIALHIRRTFSPDDFVCASEVPLTKLNSSGLLSKEQVFDLGDAGAKVTLKVLVSHFQA